MRSSVSSQVGPCAPHPTFARSPVAGRHSSGDREAQTSSTAVFAPATANSHTHPSRSVETPEPAAQSRDQSHVNWRDSRLPPRTEKLQKAIVRRTDASEDRKEATTHVSGGSELHCPATRRLATPGNQCHDEEWCRSVRAQRVLEALCGVWARRMKGKNVCGVEQLRTRRELMLAMRHIASYVAWYQDEERRGAWKRC
ncbi:hypothetical protein OH76DRAFT_770680 [Lentinus brumalis]|uniref:Uncharacterized protein n=1 Tax=Lentinus brumalis TaxID=2498619 RepID=A0A371D4P7_9APHY|nr:hypothetical protein OH76DRAFT_770680 [Polyporus brumalis]